MLKESLYRFTVLIAAGICLSLFNGGRTALAVVVYRTTADAHKVFIEKRTVSCRRWAINGSINFFIGLFAVLVGIHIDSCSNYWVHGSSRTTTNERNNNNCAVAGAALTAIGWVGSMLYAFCRAYGWFTDDRPSDADAPKRKQFSTLLQVIIILTYSVICFLIYRSSMTMRLNRYLYSIGL